MDQPPIRYALAALGASAVAIGALAAHAPFIAGDERVASLLETGSRYQMWHTLAALAVHGFAPERKMAIALFIAGILLFSGSLYMLAAGAAPIYGMIAPIGGLTLIAAWLSLAIPEHHPAS